MSSRPAAMAEEIIEPALEICDPHHHLWDQGPDSVLPREVPHHYLLPEFLADVAQGHRVTSSVFLECHAFYRRPADDVMASVGEVEFANGMAAIAASGRYGDVAVCAGIVAAADLTRGDAVLPLLNAHIRAGGERLKGIRHNAACDPTGTLWSAYAGAQPLLERADFRAGLQQLAPLGLTYECWLFHHQISELTALARAFPEQPMLLNHIATPILSGPYAGQEEAVFALWKTGIEELATCPNVHIKIGGFAFLPHSAEQAASSQGLADRWRPYAETCILAFGAERAMFESNFPVDAQLCSYGMLWNAYKRIAAGCSEDEKRWLFRDSARQFYRLAERPAHGDHR